MDSTAGQSEPMPERVSVEINVPMYTPSTPWAASPIGRGIGGSSPRALGAHPTMARIAATTRPANNAAEGTPAVDRPTLATAVNIINPIHRITIASLRL